MHKHKLFDSASFTIVMKLVSRISKGHKNIQYHEEVIAGHESDWLNCWQVLYACDDRVEG